MDCTIFDRIYIPKCVEYKSPILSNSHCNVIFCQTIVPMFGHLYQYIYIHVSLHFWSATVFDNYKDASIFLGIPHY